MNVNEITAVILCGGKGERLGPLLSGLPKPMVTIGETPFVELVIDYLKKQGIQRIVLCLGYKPEVIINYFKEFNNGLEIQFSQEHESLGTAGALKNAENLLLQFPVLVLNGDTHYSVNINELLEFHEKQKGIATIVVTIPRARQDGGSITVDSHYRVISFEEKPDKNQASLLNAGMYVFERGFVEEIPYGPSSLEKEIIPGMLGKKIFAFSVNAPQYDIGTPERLHQFRNMHLASRTE